MKCKKCGKVCFELFDTTLTNNSTVSSCCHAEIDYTDYSKDEFQNQPKKHRSIIPAFPVKDSEKRLQYQGMDLRDYFAAKAMQGLIKEIEILEKYFDQSEIHTREDITESVSEIAYSYADAMMKERNK